MEKPSCGLPHQLSFNGICLVCSNYNYTNTENPILQDAYYTYQYAWHKNTPEDPREFESELWSKHRVFVVYEIRNGRPPKATVSEEEAEILRRIEQWTNA